MLTRLQQETGLEVPLATFFRHPTTCGLAEHLQPPTKSDPVPANWPISEAGRASTGIAIVGMAGRFPGANNVGQLWANLCRGAETITFFSDEELDHSVPAALRRDPAYVRARGTLEDVENFDAGFFGISPREAELMDPQQRLFLETAWEALENAGHVPEQLGGRIGVYAGAHNSSYYLSVVSRISDFIARAGEFQTMLANEKDYLATRAAYALNLTGPAVSVYTACSTSLVAVVQAVQALLAGQCDLALAGGVTVICPQNSGYLSQEGAMLSADGRCRPFDADAGGTLFGNGVGVVALRRLEDALADGDTIYAVIRGAALNNDGARKASFTAPAVEGRVEVIAAAQAMAGVASDSISYVEAHGTATPLGDPVDVEALTLAFRRGTNRKQFCARGSNKSNFGHLVSAAGVAGLIKAALALHHEQLPPTLHFRTPNPRIDWANSPYYVVDRLTPWPRGGQPRRAAVSSFGVGGTNAHVVLEEAPHPARAGEEGGERLLLLSARNEPALEQATQNLISHLDNSPSALPDVAYTLHKGRRAFVQRRFVVAGIAAEAAERLRNARSDFTGTRRCEVAADVVFLFPGQGTQYSGMRRELYESLSARKA
jgi:acyl transferase domain-containing protein